MQPKLRVLISTSLLVLFSFLSVFALGQTTNAYIKAGLPTPSVTSDKDDYQPGDIAYIKGTGWTLDKQVHVEFKEEPDYPDFHIYDVVVDENGNWEIEYPIETRHLGVKFIVTSTGKQSATSVISYFTDNVISLSISSPKSTSKANVLPGCTVKVDFVVSTNNGGSGTGTATIAIKGTNGIIVSGQVNNVLENKSNQPFAITLTIPANTPAGLYDVELSATQGNGSINPIIEAGAINVVKANAGSDQNVNGTSTTLAATIPIIGSGSWSIISGESGTLSSTSNAFATFSGTANSSYILRWTVESSGCSAKSTDDVMINFKPASIETSTSIIDAEGVYGDESVTLTANVNPSSVIGNVEFFVNGISIGTAGISSGTATKSYNLLNVGANNYSITAKYLGNTPYLESNSTEGVLSVGKAPLTFTADNKSKDYSDPNPALTYTVSGFVNGEVINTSGITGVPSLTTTAISNSNAGTTHQIIISQGTLSSLNYSFLFVNGTLSIVTEDAIVDYTGASFASTGCTNCTSAKVQLAATILDYPDGNRGDITTAKVRFKLVPLACTNSQTAETAIYTDWLNINVVNSGDKTLGTVSIEKLLEIGNCNAKMFEVYIEVQGNYDASTQLEGTITVSKTLSDYVVGGGYISSGDNVTNTTSGIYKSDNKTKTNFGFTVKYNKAGTNLQGNTNIVIRSGGKVYKVKGIVGGSNGSLGVNVNDKTNKKAVVIAKGNFMYAETETTVPNGNNATVQITMADKGEPGAKIDVIGITIWGSNGELFYSSNWISTITVEKQIDGGNIQVNGTNVGSVTPTTQATQQVVTEARAAEVIEPMTKEFSLKAFPNPSTAYFNVQVTSDKVNEKINVRVLDLYGRTIEVIQGAYSGQTIKLGAAYRPGIYFVEMIQGSQRKQVKIMKQGD